MSVVTTERLTKILHETQTVISECNSRGVHGSVEVNARLFENVLLELLRRRAAMLQGAENVESRCTIQAAPALDSSSKNAESRCGKIPVILEGLIAAVNRLFDSDGSRGCYSAIRCRNAHEEVERLLAAAPHFREIGNSSTNNFRENAETSTKCPKCGGRGSYHCPQVLGTVECECTLPAAPQQEVKQCT